MKEQLNKITDDINSKKHELLDKTESYFSGISIPSGETRPAPASSSSKPPITHILYGIAGLAAIGGCCSDGASARVLCFATAAASAFGGWKTGQKKVMRTDTAKSGNNVSINALKNDVTHKVLDVVRKIKSEWEGFMELQQDKLQKSIRDSSIDDETKDKMLSRIFVYEVLDINLMDFNEKMRGVNDLMALRSAVSSFKLKVTQAIENAAQKQISKYNSIFE